MSRGCARSKARASSVGLALAVGLIASVEPAPVEAQRSLRVESWDVTLSVRDDGTMTVVESLRYRFTGSWNGVYRDIPIIYGTPRGFEHRLELEDIDVTNPAGGGYTYEVSREGRNRRVKVWVPGAADATHTVQFRYRVRNPLLFFDGAGDGFTEGYDELYWNVTGHESTVPVDAVSAMIFLPEGITGVEARVYTGPYGSQASAATIDPIPGGYEIRSTGSFAPQEGMTVDLAWDPGVVSRPGPLAKALRLVMWNWVLLLPLLSFILTWRHWKTHGKDPSRLAVTTRYEPPDGMIPAEVGTLVDNRPDLRDITASLIDLAVRGYVRIEQREEGGILGFGKEREYTFESTKERTTWSELTLFERELLQSLFLRAGPSSTSVRTEDLETDFYTSLPLLRTRLFDQMVDAGLYRRRPDRVVADYLGYAIGLGVATAVLLAVAHIGGLLSAGPMALVIGGIGTAIPPLLFAPLMSRRTGTGTRRLEQVLGFEEFLDRVEKDRMERLIESPDMFERYLPFAMALGVEKRWARAFEDIYQSEPTWYVGANHGTLSSWDLARGLDLMNTRTGSAMASEPRPQSSSGSGSFGGGFGGGGGFSGGGFGGGGTGGF
jgi:uncharacterized membrane protein YgcG